MHLFATHFGTYECEFDAVGEPRLLPFRHDADPSPLGFGYPELARHPERTRKPMVRRSWLDKGPLGRRTGALRGREDFVEVSWDKVTTLIAEELQRVRHSYGNQAIFGGSYGWASAGRFHHAQSQLKRLLNLAGGFTSSVNTYSYGAAGVLLPHILGSDYKDACDTAPSWNDIAANCGLIVAFGGFRLTNAQIEAGGTGSHSSTTWLERCQNAGTRIVVFSPVASDAPAGDNVEHIALRPNTDVAVMLAMCHQLLSEGRFDRELVDRCTVGVDVFANYLSGKADGIVKNAQWAAEISGVSAETIRRIGNELREIPSLINVAWALQRARHGEQPFWAAIALGCMAGHIGKRGCGFAFGLTAVNSVGQPVRRLKGPSFDQGPNPVKHFIPVARITELLEGSNSNIDYNGARLNLPDIKLLWWAGGNPFHHHQDLNRLARAFERPETIIVSENMWTATARMADIVLPSAFPFERNDIAASSRDNWIVFSRKLMNPPDGVLTDHEAYLMIAEKLGVNSSFNENLDVDQWLERLYEGYREAYPELPGYQQFRQRGFAALDEGCEAPAPADHFQRFVNDPDESPLKTPSGRIEITSKVIGSFGYEDIGQHPAWLPPEEWLGSEKRGRNHFHLLSPQPVTRLHSQLDHASLSQNSKADGYERFFLCAEDAARLELAEGEICELHNERGRTLAVLSVGSLMPGVAVLPTGGWYRLDADGVDHGGNPNVLTAITSTSQLAQGSAPNSCLVSIRAWKGASFRLEEGLKT